MLLMVCTFGQIRQVPHGHSQKGKAHQIYSTWMHPAHIGETLLIKGRLRLDLKVTQAWTIYNFKVQITTIKQVLIVNTIFRTKHLEIKISTIKLDLENMLKLELIFLHVDKN